MDKNRWFALGGSLVLALAGMAYAAPSAEDQMKAEMAAMKARIAELEGKQNANWLNERRAEEVKALVREVLADADTRASLMSNAMSAGYDGNNFFLASEDGTMLMRVSTGGQFRYVANFRNDASKTGPVGFAVPPIAAFPVSGPTGTPADDVRAGFELTRVFIQTDGHVGTPKLTYFVRIINYGATDTPQIDFKVGFDLGQVMDGNLTLNAGRFYGPFNREQMTSEFNQLAVEASSFSAFFGIARVEGIGLTWTGSMAKAAIMINDGMGSGQMFSGFGATNFAADGSDIAVTSRLDVKLAGDWKQMDDFNAWSGEPLGAFLGVAMHYEVAETGTFGAAANPNPIVENFFAYVVDGSIEYQGLNLYAAFAGMHIDGNPDFDGGTGDFTQVYADHYGFVVQGGYMVIPDKLEPFARYEWIEFDSPLGGASTDTSLITFGANYYLNKHKAKVTADVVIALDPINGRSGGSAAGGIGVPPLSSGASPAAGSGAGTNNGLLVDNTSKDTQVAVRIQLQLLF